MKRTPLALVGALLTIVTVAPPTFAAPGAECPLRLDVDPVHAYGETVVIKVSGLTGVGGIDIFTSWRNRVEEDHLFLVPGITEFDYIYRAWSVPGEPPPPPLEPGHYRVHAEDIQCEVHVSFRVTR
jgi:hypothetical protein